MSYVSPSTGQTADVQQSTGELFSPESSADNVLTAALGTWSCHYQMGRCPFSSHVLKESFLYRINGMLMTTNHGLRRGITGTIP